MTNTANNVTPIESKQTTPATKFTIQATLGGFPVILEGEGRAGDLRVIIDRLKAIGAEPPQAATPAQSEPTKPAGVPVCPDHNVPLKSGRHGWYCSKRVGAGYCNQTA